MRYRKGMIVLSEVRDYPLLRRVLHSGFVTAAQLYEFMKLDYCASSRKAFDNRLRRLVNHQLLVRHDFPDMNRGVVYSVSESGASELIGKGEYYSGRPDHAKEPTRHAHHALELNEIHLALKRTGMLIRWTPETDIRSQNEFTQTGYWKDYDALVSVRVGERECGFALEYERTPKSKWQYKMIQSKIESEGSVAHFLYLAPNYDLLLFLVRRFESCRRPVYFGLWKDFLTHGLGVSVRNNRSAVSTTLRAILALKPQGPGSRASYLA
jgi:hypothetical protein